MSGRLTGALHRLAASRSELEAEDERRARVPGTVPVADLVARRRARVAGTVTALTYPPASEHPALVARLADGTGVLELVFLGRRDVPGIEPGRRLVVEGTVVEDRGRRLVYNPAYTLLPGVAA